MTSKLTREQLIKKAQEQIAFCRDTKVTGEGRAHVDQCAALFEIALAAMDSEPVGEFYEDGPLNWYQISDGDRVPDSRRIPLYRHAQQPVVPATLPCSVELKPGLIIGKGCKTETLLTALRRRADYNADIDAMTPEERAEHDASIKAFKAMLPQPAPIVPDGLIAAVNRLLDSDGSRGCYSAIRCHHARAEVERLLAAAPQEVR